MYIAFNIINILTLKKSKHKITMHWRSFNIMSPYVINSYIIKTKDQEVNTELK